MAAGWDASDTNATQLTTITTEQFFDETPQLAYNQEAHVDVEVDFPVTPTDHAVVSVYRSVNDTPAYDTVPFITFTIDNGIDPSKRSFVVPHGTYQFRVGVKRTGSTDTLTSADMVHRIATLS